MFLPFVLFKSWPTLGRSRAAWPISTMGLLDADEYEARASVQGTQHYRVRLGATPDGELDCECDCPVGDEGIWCKHAVAVALSWLESPFSLSRFATAESSLHSE